MSIFSAVRNIWGHMTRMASDATYQTRNVDMSSSSDFWYSVTEPETKSGVEVTDTSAMRYSAVWAATRLLSGTMGMLPLDLYRRVGKGREVMIDDPRETLVHDRPNVNMGAMMFRSQAAAQQVNAGNTYAEIERNGRDMPFALHPIHYTRVTPKIDDATGKLVYEVKNNREAPTYIPAADMLHVPSMMSDDGICGKGVIQNARESIGFGMATEQYGAGWFGSGAIPRVVVSSPKSMLPAARDNFRKEWKQVYGRGNGSDGSNVGLLTEGMTVAPLNISAQDQQFLETRQHNVEEIARWYGVPPHMIQQLLRATFSNIEHQQIEFVSFSLMPWLKLWEQELWAKLLTPEEQKSMYFEFNVNALLRGDSTARSNLYRSGITTGWLSPNECREFENLNPYDEGDDFYMQGAMLPVDMLGQQPQTSAGIGGESKPVEEPTDTQASSPRDRIILTASSAMLSRSVAHIMRRDAHEARKAAKKPREFMNWLDGYYSGDYRQNFESAIQPACDALSALGYAVDSVSLSESQSLQSHRELLEASGSCTAEDLAPTVDGIVTAWEQTRPNAVTSTITGAYHA